MSCQMEFNIYSINLHIFLTQDDQIFWLQHMTYFRLRVPSFATISYEADFRFH